MIFWKRLPGSIRVVWEKSARKPVCLLMDAVHCKDKKNHHRWANYSIGQRWKVSGIWEVKLVLLGKKKIMTR